MEIWNEIRSSRRVGSRPVDPKRAGWEELGLEIALEQPALTFRYMKTMRFITESVDVEALKKSCILDAGEFNPFSLWLKDTYGVVVQNTDSQLDFDYCYQNTDNLRRFDYVFAFEILEHLMNPLAFLEFLQRSLTRNGRIFLSTPYARPRFLWSKYHITEYYPDKVEAMANKAGLKVIRYTRENVYPIRAGFAGIRPIFRALWFERIMLFELDKELPNQ